MTPEAPDRICEAVRRALLGRSFNEIGRDAVEQHLAEHDACAKWASDVVQLSYLLNLARDRRVATGGVADTLLAAYLEGQLDETQRRLVEDECCHDLQAAKRLQQMRSRRLQKQFETLRPEAALRLVRPFESETDQPLIFSLERLTGLSLHRPLAVAAAQDTETTVQTPDGRFVVTVVDRTAGRISEPHHLQIGIRAHEPEWIGRWACYRVMDANLNLAAVGLIRIEEHGNLIRVTVPPTEHAPYTVQVQMVSADTEQLEAAIAAITSQAAPGTRAGEKDVP
jgi:hypothetical protein